MYVAHKELHMHATYMQVTISQVSLMKDIYTQKDIASGSQCTTATSQYQEVAAVLLNIFASSLVRAQFSYSSARALRALAMHNSLLRVICRQCPLLMCSTRYNIQIRVIHWSLSYATLL